MKLHFNNPTTKGFLSVFFDEEKWSKKSLLEGSPNYALVWNRGKKQTAFIDNEPTEFEKDTVLPLMVNQHVDFEHAQDLIIWEFNREFYCIVDHDTEVSCVGFLFYGMRELFLVNLSEKESYKFDLLFKVFVDEFEEKDDIQGEMLRMLLKRLIIKITRLAKNQQLSEEVRDTTKLDFIREYNLLVELHYKSEHQVQFYADKMHKSPKTISNLFSKYSSRTPSEIIQNRLYEEAKRLLIYTNKTNKEIASELSFEDYSHFNRFFKRNSGESPTSFRKKIEKK